MESDMKNMRTVLIVSGASAMAIAGLMALITVLTFTLRQAPSPFMDALEGICFYGFIPIALAGASLLIVGARLKKEARDSS
jgi:hypothetical protein